MEFLTKDFHRSNNSYPVNLVLQSRESALAGFDAAHPAPNNNTNNNENPNFVLAYLPFDPTAGFHEYRIDYLPDRVLFFADGQQLASMAGSAAVPTTPGHLILQHWSNGNPLWSGGPPSLAAAKAQGDPDGPALEVRYVKAYFNSSTIIRNDDGGEPQQKWEGEAEYNSRCRDPTAVNAVCEIPEVTPQDASAASWFFGDHTNMTHGTVQPPGGSGSNGDGESDASRVIMGMAWVAVLLSGWLMVL
ncbi:glycoside hydrolase family 16 protein [Chaetomium sp. MPI-SDFR-AT-0129]|nr:glycoside hydrolase family 16 protein [Chaetomium sp. MPI-SDFR-AT-0129]